MILNAFEITILVLTLFFIVMLMNMFKYSDKLARILVKKDDSK